MCSGDKKIGGWDGLSLRYVPSRCRWAVARAHHHLRHNYHGKNKASRTGSPGLTRGHPGPPRAREVPPGLPRSHPGVTPGHEGPQGTRGHPETSPRVLLTALGPMSLLRRTRQTACPPDEGQGGPEDGTHHAKGAFTQVRDKQQRFVAYK